MRFTIRRRLQGSFALIALAALGIALSNYLQYGRLAGDAHAINLMGSQRMRSYRLAALASRYAAEPDRDTARAIDAELARFPRMLEALRDGDAAFDLKPAPSPAARGLLDAGLEDFKDYEARIRALVARADRRAPTGHDVSAIFDAAASLASRMDQATSELESVSAGAVSRYGRLQLALFAVTAAIALASFEGMRRHVLGRFPALEAGLHEVAHGHLGAKVDLGAASDEVGRLESAFNEMSAELERARAELLRADEHKSQFIANMSHELRTPLTSVIGFADNLRKGLYGPLTEQQNGRVDAILRNARSLLGLIGDVLDLAKIEAGKMDVRPVTVDVGALVADVAEALRPLAEARRLALEVQVEGELPAVVTDPDRVRQILLNLGSNAVKFTEKGAVRLRASTQESGEVRIEVEDTGIGIAPADLARLFRRFEQVDGSGTRRHGGAGLGLHISRRIAELLGARIDVESEPGRGSRFALLLPGKAMNRGGNSHGHPESTEANPGRL